MEQPTANTPGPGSTEAGDGIHDIIVIGASTGGVEALMRLARRLPGNLRAAIFVVLHLSPYAPSHLPQILSREGPLPAHHPVDREPIRSGRIYIAPPDRHLMIERDRIRVVRGPRENRHRPAVDPLFRSAALAYGPRVIGVVLTGALDDGTAGLQAIKRYGGIAIVQDPADALFPSMPESAMDYVQVDYCLPLAKIAPLLAQLVPTPAADDGDDVTPTPNLQYETNIAKMDAATLTSDERPGELAGFMCPECGGPLYELQEGQLLLYRCRVGHAFTGKSALTTQLEALEEALWSAYNTLRESALVAERLADDARRRGHDYVAVNMDRRAMQQQQRADVVRGLISETIETEPEASEEG